MNVLNSERRRTLAFRKPEALKTEKHRVFNILAVADVGLAGVHTSGEAA